MLVTKTTTRDGGLQRMKARRQLLKMKMIRGLPSLDLLSGGTDNETTTMMPPHHLASTRRGRVRTVGMVSRRHPLTVDLGVTRTTRS